MPDPVGPVATSGGYSLGVPRQWLSDDPIPKQPWLLVGQALDDDPGPGPFGNPPFGQDETATLPVLTVKQRSRIGYSDDGNPLFRWVTVVSARATYFESLTLLGNTGGATGPARRLGRLGRFQTDIEAGKSVVFAEATVPLEGDYEGEEIREDAKVYHENGERYDIVRVITHPTAVDLQIARPSGGQ